MQNSSRGRVDPFIVMDVLDAARRAEAAGRDIVHMEIGQPGTPAPAAARAAVAVALEHDTLGYTVALGLPELRQRIARLYRDWYGLTIDPARIVVTSGASGAFLLALTALFDAGDRVGLGVPCYPSYRQILSALSLRPVGIDTDASTRFLPTPAALPADLAGLILASPGNPTGTVATRPELAALIAAAGERGLAVISDEIYHGLSYGQPAVSALELSDDLFVINSFSKYFSMTGWRVGWMVVPQSHVRTIERLAQNMFICAPHVSQIAALAALDAEAECRANIAAYAQNRAILLDGLARAGLNDLAPPDGAFFIYADVSSMTDDALAFADRILAQAGVAVTPGLDFDPVRGGRFLRFSYAAATGDIRRGTERLVEFFRKG